MPEFVCLFVLLTSYYSRVIGLLLPSKSTLSDELISSFIHGFLSHGPCGQKSIFTNRLSVKAVSSMADKAVMWLLGAVVYFWEVSTMAPLLIFLKRQTLEKHFSEAYAEAFKWGSSRTKQHHLVQCLKASLLIVSSEWNSENIKQHFSTPVFFCNQHTCSYLLCLAKHWLKWAWTE